MSTGVPANEVYRTHMAEAKLRLLAAERMSKAQSSLTGHVGLDIEFCFLQIRRVIELITFSAMVLEEARYRKLRELQHQQDQRNHGNPSKDWQADEILRRLVSLSPHVLPIPIAKATQSAPGLVHFERHQMSVNHDRLIQLYKRCGGYLHGKNPLVEDFGALVNLEREKYVKAPKEIKRELEFLRRLLWRHAAITLDWTDPSDPKSVDGPRSAWIVDFGGNNGHEIAMAIGEAHDA